MEPKIIKFRTLSEIGEGVAKIDDNFVDININGINGALKAWLIGKNIEAVPIGNVVNGRLHKSINTSNHAGILITQSGRQMLIGEYKDEKLIPVTDNISHADCPLSGFESFTWHKISTNKFCIKSEAVKFLLSNKYIYQAFKTYGYYWVGEKGNEWIIAIPSKKDENPLSFLGETNSYRQGYRVVCLDENLQKIYAPKINA